VRKGQTAKQENKLIQLKETFPRYKLTNYRSLARLRLSKDFPYANQPRIYNEVSKAIDQAFQDIASVFHYLPLSYRTKILAQSSFHRLFTDEVFPSLKEKEQKKKQTDEATEYESYIIYQTMFAIGIEGLIRKMPTGFQNHLMKQITPVMQLMDSITTFYRNTTGKKDIPNPYVIPDTLDYRI